MFVSSTIGPLINSYLLKVLEAFGGLGEFDAFALYGNYEIELENPR